MRYNSIGHTAERELSLYLDLQLTMVRLPGCSCIEPYCPNKHRLGYHRVARCVASRSATELDDEEAFIMSEGAKAEVALSATSVGVQASAQTLANERLVTMTDAMDSIRQRLLQSDVDQTWSRVLQMLRDNYRGQVCVISHIVTHRHISS